MSDLPKKNFTKSEDKIISYFDNYFNRQVELNASEFDATLGFFEKRGFDTTAARTISQVLLTQARVEGIKIFELLDSLQGFSKKQLSAVVTRVLNASRDKTSQLGYRTYTTSRLTEIRNLTDPVPSTINILDETDIDIPIDNNDYIQLGYVQPGYVE